MEKMSKASAKKINLQFSMFFNLAGRDEDDDVAAQLEKVVKGWDKELKGFSDAYLLSKKLKKSLFFY
jgi:hypothetical protein